MQSYTVSFDISGGSTSGLLGSISSNSTRGLERTFEAENPLEAVKQAAKIAQRLNLDHVSNSEGVVVVKINYVEGNDHRKIINVKSFLSEEGYEEGIRGYDFNDEGQLVYSPPPMVRMIFLMQELSSMRD